MELARFDRATFLRETWQQKPLLIRNPWANWRNPIPPDELAGMACEDAIESRLIVGSGRNLSLEHGPLRKTRFKRLAKQQWTLLVQSVDHHVSEVAALIAPFRFIPNWRIDDVMVSYAVDGGGVGPHFDHYDVFLIQGLGQRRWQLGQRCNDDTPLLPHDDLRLLANFEVIEEFVLDSGDMLYVPPGVAHNGIAIGDDCMTYSIGFRAPSRRELIGYWVDDLIADLRDDDRYTDAGLALQDNPGEISAAALTRLHDLVTAKLTDRDAFVDWFGRYSSARKHPEWDWGPSQRVSPQKLRTLISAGLRIERNPASRFAFTAGDDGALLLFVDGSSFSCRGEDAGFARALCASDRFAVNPALATSRVVRELISRLYNAGSIAFGDDD